MSIYGIGNYYILKDGKLVDKCVASFELLKSTQVSVQPYEKVSNRQSIDTEAAIKEITYIVNLKSTDNSFETLSNLLSLAESSLISGQPQVFINSSGGQLSEQIIDYDLINFDNECLQYKFAGVAFMPNGTMFGVAIENMYRSQGVTLTAQDAIDQQFIAIQPRVYEIVQAGLMYTIAIAPLPTEYEPNSELIISGIVSLSDMSDPTGTEITLTFPFVTPSPVTVLADAQGIFTFEVNTLGSLTPGDTTNIVITADGNEVFNQAASVPVPLFTAAISGGMLVGGQGYSVFGNAPSGTLISFTSVGFGGLLDGTTTTAVANDTFQSDLFNVPVGSPEFTGTITVSAPGFTDIVLNANTTLKGYNPTAGLGTPSLYEPNISENLLQVNPNELSILTIEAGGQPVYSSASTSTNEGSLIFNNINFTTANSGQVATFTFTEVSTSDVEVVLVNLPVFDDASTAINVDAADVYSGLFATGPEQNEVTGTYFTSETAPTTISVKDGPTTIAFTEVTGTGALAPYTISVQDPNIVDNTYTIELTANSHTTTTQNKLITQGFSAELTSIPLIFRGATIEFTGEGEVGETITVNLFGSNFNAIINGSGDWSTNILVPISASFGVNVATISCTGVPYSGTINVNVQEIFFTSNAPPSILITGASATVINGTGEPGQTVVATLTGVTGEVPENIVVPANGVWAYSFDGTRQDAGVYNLTFTHPGFTDLVYAGTHEPIIQFTPSALTVLQGDPTGAITIDAPKNQNVTVSATNSQINFDNLGVLNTGASGTFVSNYDAITLTTNTESTETLTVMTNSGTQTENFVLTINPRVPITVNFTFPGLPSYIPPNTAFTNSNVTVFGNSPTNGVLNISAIDGVADITINTQVADTYNATLLTANEPGSVEITVATVFQPSEVNTFNVIYPITVTAPATVDRSETLQVTIQTEASEPITVALNGSISGVLDSFVGTTDGTGELVYTFEVQPFEAQNLELTIATTFVNLEEITISLTDNFFGGSGPILGNFTKLIRHYSTVEQWANGYYDVTEQASTSESFNRGGSWTNDIKKYPVLGKHTYNISQQLSALTIASTSSNFRVDNINDTIFTDNAAFSVSVNIVIRDSGTNNEFLFFGTLFNTDKRIIFVCNIDSTTNDVTFFGRYTDTGVTTDGSLTPAASIQSLSANKITGVIRGSANSIDFYVNENFVGTSTFPFAIDISSPSSLALDSNYLSLSGITLYDKSLIASEVAALFDSNGFARPIVEPSLDFMSTRSFMFFSPNVSTTYGKVSSSLSGFLTQSSELIPNVSSVLPTIINDNSLISTMPNYFLFTGSNFVETSVSSSTEQQYTLIVLERANTSNNEIVYERRSSLSTNYRLIDFVGNTLRVTRTTTSSADQRFDFVIPDTSGILEILIQVISGVCTVCVNGVVYIGTPNLVGALSMPAVTTIGSDSVKTSYFAGKIWLIEDKSDNTSISSFEPTIGDMLFANQSNQILNRFGMLAYQRKLYSNLKTVYPTAHFLESGTPSDPGTPEVNFEFENNLNNSGSLGGNLNVNSGTVNYVAHGGGFALDSSGNELQSSFTFELQNAITDSFTYSCDFNLGTLASWAISNTSNNFAKGSLSAVASEWGLNFVSNAITVKRNHLSFFMDSAVPVGRSITENVPIFFNNEIPENTWVNITVVYYGFSNSIVIFVDGLYHTTTSLTGVWSDGTTTVSLFFNDLPVLIDNFRIWKKALTTEEVQFINGINNPQTLRPYSI